MQRVVRRAARFELVRRILFKYSGRKSKRINRVHPFDIQYHVDTSGWLHGALLGSGDERDPLANSGYGGSQPSIIRAALNLIPEKEKTAFVDLGCGKGRALIVASEFSFRSVTGIEISPELAQIAERNARVLAQEHPERTQIRIVTGDALDIDSLPSGDLAIYLYHPFGKSLIERLLSNIEYALGQERRTIYVIYYNPVWGQVFDGSSLLRRISATTTPYDATEIEYGPDSNDVVIIWQDSHNAPSDVPEEAARRIVLAGWHAELADLPE